MKKTALLLAVLFLPCLFIPAKTVSKENPSKIVITPKPGQPITRSDNELVECWYVEENGVEAYFHVDLGYAIITIYDDNGIVAQSSGNSSSGVIIIPMANISGIYNIQITTTCGLDYEGVFTI